MPTFLIALFLVPAPGGAARPLLALLAYVPLLVIVVLVRNTAPRVRVDQALRFFWGPMTAAAVAAVALAALGW